MKKIYIILLLVSTIQLYSQYVPEWITINSQGLFDSYRPNLTAIDNLGNIYASFSVFGTNADVVTVKYNSFGNLVWTRTYNSSTNEGQDRPVKLILDASGNVYVFGNSSTDDYLFNKIFILKYNSGGSLINSIDYRRAENPITVLANSESDSLGNFYICGSTDNMFNFIDSSLVVKLNASLNVLWEKTKRDTSDRYNFVNSVKSTTGNNIIATEISGKNIITNKYSSAGNVIWSKKINIPNLYNSGSYPVSVCLDNNQNIYTGSSVYQVNLNDTSKIVLFKIDPAGNLLWNNIYNISNQGNEVIRRIFSDNNSIFLDVQELSSQFLIKLNSGGIMQWQKAIDHYVYFMNNDDQGYCYSIGYKNTYQRTELCFEKYNSDGSINSSSLFTYNGTGNDHGINFFKLPDSKFIITGYHNYEAMIMKVMPSNTNTFTFSRYNLIKPITDLQDTYDTISLTADKILPYSKVKNVYVNIDTILHSSTGDLRIYLMHEGKTDTLIYQRGGFADNFFGTKLRDTAQTPICNSNNAPFTGYFSPCYPLNQFKNLNATGPWILKIYDRRSPDTGILKSWSLIIEYESPIGINTVSNEIPEKYNLSQNYPNPFNPVTRIKFSIPKQSFVKITVYDIIGKEINVLADDFLQAGTYETEFDASSLPSGVYFYSISTKDFIETKKMVLIK